MLYYETMSLYSVKKLNYYVFAIYIVIVMGIFMLQPYTL